MTDPDLEAIEKRANAATRGPWYYYPPEHVGGHHVVAEHDWILMLPFEHEETNLSEQARFKRPNGVFIAHARKDIPDLLAAIKARDEFLTSLPCFECAERTHSSFGCVRRPAKDDYSCCYSECEACGWERNALAAFKNKQEK